MVLTQLRLDDFGKFKNRVFNFKPCTVFYGKNESGKTTIIDALFLLLLDKLTSSTTVQLLADRYGDTYSIAVAPQGLAKTLSLAELVNFYLVRSSKLQIDFSGTANTGVIKSKLLETSFNLESFISAIEKDLGDKAKSSYGFRLKELSNKKEAIKRAIEENQRYMENYTEQALRYKKIEADLKIVHASLAEIKTKTDNTRQYIDTLRKQEEKLSEALVAEKVVDWISRANAYLEEKQAWERKYGELEPAKIEALFTQESETRKKIEAVENETSKTRGKVQNLRILMYRSRVLVPLLIVSIIAALVSLGAVIVGAIIQNLLFIIVGVCGLLAGGVVFLVRYLRKNSLVAEAQRIIDNVSIQTLGDVTHYLVACEDAIKNNTVSVLQETLEKILKEKERLLQRYGMPHEQALLKYAAEKEINITALKAQFSTIIDTFPVKDLRAAGLEPKVQKELSINATDETIKSLLFAFRQIQTNFVESSNNSDITKLPEIKRELGIEEKTLKELDNEYQNLLLKKDALTNALNDTYKTLAGFDSHALEYEEAVQKLEQVTSEIATLEFEKRALQEVVSILQVIEKNMQRELNFIESDMKEYFSGIVPAFGTIEVQDVTAKSILLPDITKSPRAVYLLSQGTQDLFYLGFRMLLGEYLWEEGVSIGTARGAARVQEQADKTIKRTKPGFFLWDEPFVALDSERLGLAVAMLKVFQEKTDFQHVIFTKDPELVDKLKKTWDKEKLSIHELTVS